MKRSMLTFHRVLLSGLFLVTFIVSCGKEGPAGPKGDDGAPGPAGPKGDAGTGSSAVYYSPWLNVGYTPDTMHTAGGTIDTVGWFATIDAPRLTLAMLSTADVKVYLNSGVISDPTIYPMPYRASNGLYIDMLAYEKSIELYSNSNVSSFNGRFQYRYMIVPGNTQAKSDVSIDWSDYNAVKTYLGLKD